MLLRPAGILCLLWLAGCSDPTAILVHIGAADNGPAMMVPEDINRLVVAVSADGVRVATKDVQLYGPTRALHESLTLVPGSGSRGGIMILVEGFQGVFRVASGAKVIEFSEGEITEITLQIEWLEGECQDEDGDGYGEGRGCLGSDCNDADAAIYWGAMERCNNVDDDCDFAVDEDFDLQSDVENCGSCGHRCDFKNGSGKCQYGQCVLTGCIGGYFDANRIPDDGCECSPTVPPDEVCDGLDNDCDGTVDNGMTGCAAGVCMPDKWCWENPLPQGNQLNAVWGAAADDIWAVGALGVILHWDGTSWKGADSGTTRQLNSVWGGSAGDVWTVGVLGTILRLGGGVWQNFPGGTSYDLMDVWGSAQNDVWAVGDPGISGSVSHYNGRLWSNESFPGTEWLQGVWGAGANDVWTVGTWGKIRRYNGTSWQEYTSGLGATDDLFAVWGSSASDVWAVGTGITRFNGSSWTKQGTAPDSRLHSVFGFGASDAWAVGDAGAILRWQGSIWNTVQSGTSAKLLGVWGTSPDDVWAVGQWGTILRRTGGSWTSASRGATADLHAVWGIDSQSVWAVGESGTILKREAGPWPEEASATKSHLHAVWGSSASDVWAVGEEGIILRRSDAGVWAGGGSFTTEDLHGIGGSGETDVWAVGEGGAVGHYAGAGWSTDPSGTAKDLFAVYSAGADAAWAVGIDGTILAYDGNWSQQASGTTFDLLDVRGLSDTDVWAVGRNGAIRHFNGFSWSDSAQGAWSQYDFHSVLPVANNLVWVAGQSRQAGGGGVLLKYDGSGWSQMTYGAENGLRGVWGTTSGEVWVAGEGGTILRFSGD